MENSVANPIASSSNRARETRRRKKKIKTHHVSNTNETSQKIAWKLETTQQLYSSKLLQALQQVRLSSPPSSASPRRGRAVREAADRVLAIAARGRTRWSRAILANRLKLNFVKHKRLRRVLVGASRLPRKPRVEILKLKGKSIASVKRKVKTLGQLVPGCRKEPLPVILEEATDYIPALEMQIRALRDILSRLSAAGVGGNEVSSLSSSESVPDNDTGSA